MVRHIYLAAWAVLLMMFSVGAAQQDFCQQRSFYTLGDANGDSSITEADIIYLANYLFRGGPEPVPSKNSADINRDGRISLGDVVRVLSVWLGRSGVAVKLEYQDVCCNKISCPYPCDSASCQRTYPISDGRVRVFIEDTLISENFADSNGNILLVLTEGIYFVVVFPPKSAVDSSWQIIPSERADWGIQTYLDSWTAEDVLAVYDTLYGWARFEQIVDSIGVDYWVHFIPNHPEWVLLKIPKCLHVTEAVEFLQAHREFIAVSQNGRICLD
jgi:hypothetical protein